MQGKGKGKGKEGKITRKGGGEWGGRVQDTGAKTGARAGGNVGIARDTARHDTTVL